MTTVFKKGILDNDSIELLKWPTDGLLPLIVQHAVSGKVLMSSLNVPLLSAVVPNSRISCQVSTKLRGN